MFTTFNSIVNFAKECIYHGFKHLNNQLYSNFGMVTGPGTDIFDKNELKFESVYYLFIFDNVQSKLILSTFNSCSFLCMSTN